MPLESATESDSAPIVFSPEESDILLAVLDPCVQAFKEQGRADLSAQMAGLLSRIMHATVAGQGMPEEMRASLRSAMHDAAEVGDGGRVERVFERWLTVLGRLEPDPHKVLAAEVTEYLRSMQAAMAMQYAGIVLALLGRKLAAMAADPEYAEFPEVQAILSYFKEWVAVGVADLAKGAQPWHADPDLK